MILTQKHRRHSGARPRLENQRTNVNFLPKIRKSERLCAGFERRRIGWPQKATTLSQNKTYKQARITRVLPQDLRQARNERVDIGLLADKRRQETQGMSAGRIDHKASGQRRGDDIVRVGHGIVQIAAKHQATAAHLGNMRYLSQLLGKVCANLIGMGCIIAADEFGQNGSRGCHREVATTKSRAMVARAERARDQSNWSGKACRDSGHWPRPDHRHRRFG